jgi:hypothetical protein
MEDYLRKFKELELLRMMKMRALKSTLWIVSIVATSVVLMSCGKFMTLKKEVRKLEGYYYLTGQLSPESKTHKSVWVFVWEKTDIGIISPTSAL